MCRVAIRRALSLIVSTEMAKCIYRVGFQHADDRASEVCGQANERAIGAREVLALGLSDRKHEAWRLAKQARFARRSAR